MKEQSTTPSISLKIPYPLFVFLTGSLLLILSRCSPTTAESALPLEPPEAFSTSGKAELPAQWWTEFEDERLNELVDKALDSNFNLLSTWYRFKAAEAVFDREESFLFPDLEAFVQGAINRPQPDFVGGENLRAGLRSSYEIDIWGRIRSSVEAEEFRAHASLWDFQSAAISLSAEVTRTWYQIMATRYQLELARAQVQTNEKILELIKARFGSGQIRGVDILRQKRLTEATREQQIFTESRLESLEHQLAVLLGVSPTQEFIMQLDSLPELPPLPQTGIPLELVRRRPDVQQAFNLLQAADRDLASAMSNRYPRLSINASVASRSNTAEGLFQDWAYTLGGNLVAPLFYAGRLNAEVDRAEAVKQQRLYEYGQAVLVAFREVEDALVREQKQRERLEVLKEQVVLSHQAYEQLQMEYFNGMRTYLDVLTALDQEQQLQRDLISAKLNLLEFRIALYAALAGGFEEIREEPERGEGEGEDEGAEID